MGGLALLDYRRMEGITLSFMFYSADANVYVCVCRACASGSRRCWRSTGPTGARPERTGPSSSSPLRTSETLPPFFFFNHLFIFIFILFPPHHRKLRLMQDPQSRTRYLTRPLTENQCWIYLFILK